MRKVHPKRTKNQRYIEKGQKDKVFYIYVFFVVFFVCVFRGRHRPLQTRR
nr:MAG TPA: hypothetical protein [Caudoviricetes sp.]